MTAIDRMAGWASAHQVRHARGSAIRATHDFRSDPRVDFGRVLSREPGLVLYPSTIDELAACVAELAACAIPFTTRGAGHSSGGQVLIEGGAVLDIRALSRIVRDDAAAQTITVEAGAWWLSVYEHLAQAGRRPTVLTGNTRTTIAGSIAMGGFGDSSHARGMQADQVLALTVITLDGARHVVGPGDPLFDYTLCGRGQLAVIADVTLATIAQPRPLAARVLGWYTLKRFLAAAEQIAARGAFAVFRPKLAWRPGQPVSAIVADVGPTLDLDGLEIDDQTEAAPLDLLAMASEDPYHQWSAACPALELVFPYPSGLATWAQVADRLVLANLHAHLAGGTAVLLTRPSRLPLAPMPPGERAFAVVVRPEIPVARAPASVPLLADLGRLAIEQGGARLYLMSIDVAMAPERFLTAQFGAALAPFRALKDRYDPQRLLNPWIL